MNNTMNIHFTISADEFPGCFQEALAQSEVLDLNGGMLGTKDIDRGTEKNVRATVTNSITYGGHICELEFDASSASLALEELQELKLPDRFCVRSYGIPGCESVEGQSVPVSRIVSALKSFEQVHNN